MLRVGPSDRGGSWIWIWIRSRRSIGPCVRCGKRAEGCRKGDSRRGRSVDSAVCRVGRPGGKSEDLWRDLAVPSPPTAVCTGQGGFRIAFSTRIFMLCCATGVAVVVSGPVPSGKEGNGSLAASQDGSVGGAVVTGHLVLCTVEHTPDVRAHLLAHPGCDEAGGNAASHV